MRTIITTLLIAFGVTCLNAQIYISPGASGTGLTSDSPIDLQGGIDFALQNGGYYDLYLAEGVYTNTPYIVEFNETSGETSGISFSGSWNNDFSTQSMDAATTVLDGQSTNRVLDVYGVCSGSPSLALDMTYITIQNGWTDDEHGAGIRLDAGDSSTDGFYASIYAYYVNFLNNSTTGSGSGGAVYSNVLSSFWHCLFDFNDAYNGGALFIFNEVQAYDAEIFNCTFSNIHNFGNQGSAIWTNRTSFEITNSEFHGMEDGGSSGNGSAVYGSTDSHLMIGNCRFEDISINYWASAVQNWDSDIDMYSCLFKNNQAGTENGYGTYAYYHNNGPDRTINIAECTFVGNEAQAGFAYGALHFRGNGSDQLNVVNSVFWDNGNNPVYSESGNSSMSNCVTEFDPLNFGSTSDIITTDPELVNGHQLSANSICVDAANETLNYDLIDSNFISNLFEDVDGSPRYLSYEWITPLDIGAVEYNAPPEDLYISTPTGLYENNPVPYAFGTLLDINGQTGDHHTYELVAGDGINDADNDAFSINSGTILVEVPTDFEVKNQYYIVVRAIDSQGQSVDIPLIVQVFDANEWPILGVPLEDQEGEVNEAFLYELPENTFYDEDAGDMLTYSATLVGGGAIPGWLTFDSMDLEFSGTPTEAGVWNIQLTAFDIVGLETSDDFTLTVLPVGLLELDDIGVDFYPNPVNDVLTIQNIKLSSITLEIHDNTGRLVHQEILNDNVSRIDISELARGAYSISILTEDRRYVSSLIKE